MEEKERIERRVEWDFNLKIAVELNKKLKANRPKKNFFHHKRSRSIKLFPVVLIKRTNIKRYFFCSSEIIFGFAFVFDVLLDGKRLKNMGSELLVGTLRKTLTCFLKKEMKVLRPHMLIASNYET